MYVYMCVSILGSLITTFSLFAYYIYIYVYICIYIYTHIHIYIHRCADIHGSRMRTCIPIWNCVYMHICQALKLEKSQVNV